MKFTQDSFDGGYAIRAYDAATVTIIGPGTPNESGSIQSASEVLRHSFALTPHRLLRDWPPQRYTDLHSDHFAILLTLEPEVVLLGTGTHFRYPPPSLLAPLTARGIGVEVMDSGAACRTYNVLAGEGRQVVAAILIERS